MGGWLAGFPGYFVGVLHPGVRGTTSEDLDQPQLTHEGSQGLCQHARSSGEMFRFVVIPFMTYLYYVLCNL